MVKIEPKIFGVVAKIAARLHRRRHDRQVVVLQRLQVVDADTDGLKTFSSVSFCSSRAALSL
ncbi:MAG: hypothetical protein M0C28_36720 [Candidatus Moduliflexus flocculans]|nr:hypothetical protein [Candidatus Moduliflexus flocculans]